MLNLASYDSAYACLLCVEALAMNDQVEKGDAYISIHVDLMDHAGGLTENAAETFNCLLIALQAHEYHSTILVVSHDFERVCTRHDRCDRMIDDLESVLEASTLEAEQRELRMEGRDLLV